jgi:hypothetical protein
VIKSYYLSEISSIIYPNIDWSTHNHLTVSNKLYPGDDAKFSDLFMNVYGHLQDSDTSYDKHPRLDITSQNMDQCINDDWKIFNFDGDNFEWWKILQYSVFTINDSLQIDWQFSFDECFGGDNGSLFHEYFPGDATYIPTP